jgi:hypothetical protein
VCNKKNGYYKRLTPNKTEGVCSQSKGVETHTQCFTK